MKILLQCTSSDENLSWCQYAIVDLLPEAMKLIAKRREMYFAAKHVDDSLWDITFWGIPGEFYDTLSIEDLLTDEQQVKLESQSWVHVSDSFEVTEEAARTECDRMVINDDGFYWKCIVKHTNVYIETVKLPYEVVT